MAGVAVLHVVQAVTPGPSPVRHAIFVVVNGAMAALLVWRHRWAFWPALVLTAQQMYSHGLELARSFNGDTALDWRALAVCLFFPTLDTILFIERQEENEAAEA